MWKVTCWYTDNGEEFSEDRTSRSLDHAMAIMDAMSLLYPAHYFVLEKEVVLSDTAVETKMEFTKVS